jgi:hypothetical protein
MEHTLFGWIFVHLFVNTIPLAFWPILTLCCVVGYLMVDVLGFIPLDAAYKIPLRVVLILTVLFSAMMFGATGIGLIYNDQITSLKNQMQSLAAESQKINIQVKTVVEVKSKVIERQHDVIKTIIQHDASAIDKQCTLSNTAWMLYNRATQSPLATSAGEPVSTESGPQAAISDPAQTQ